ncbi:MAG: prephenate dehydrogenase [Eubacterium sp.]|nr:prephenate dehydrogenase [Eubacterium sp.]
MNKNFGFIGIGLIGGSIAKTLRKVYPDCTISAYNRGEDARIQAKADGTANVVTDKVDDTFKDCDYIFLCTPVEKNTEYLQVLKDIIKDDCIITDVGSVKGNIHKVVAELYMEDNFIGGHPMAGSEKTGYENSHNHMLENAFYAITPTEKSPADKVDEYKQIVTDMGAIPIIFTPEEHDHTVATISHLPHLIASSLVNLVKDNDSKEEYMKTLAAGGFKGITRIASSSADMWEQICMTNSEEISKMLEKYIESLSEVKDELDNHRAKEIHDMFVESKDYRDNIDNLSNSIILNHFTLFCDIVDESGAIATIATILATNGVNIRNIGIVHNREFEEGVLRITFHKQDDADKAYEQLVKHRYNVIKRYE